MALRKYKNCDVWYCYFRDGNGIIRTVSTGTTDRRRAELFDSMNKDRLMVERMRKRLGSLCPVPSDVPVISTDDVLHRNGTLALADAIHVASAHSQISKRSASYWNHFISNIPVRYADEVTPKLALAYLDKFFSKGNGKSWNNHKCALNAIYRHILVHAGISQSPFATISNRSVTEIESRRNLTEDEIELILANCDEQIRCMTMLARWTAQRFETCCRMAYSMFDFERKVFLIDPSKTRRFNEWCCVPLFPQLETYLLSIRNLINDVDNTLFNELGTCTSTHYFNRKFNELLSTLNIKSDKRGKVGFHSLRGSAITWMEDAGIPSEIRHAITGHRTDKVEEIYAKSIERVSKVAKSFH